MFETVISIEKPQYEIVLEADEDNLDGLNYLAGRTLDFVNKNAMRNACHIRTGSETNFNSLLACPLALREWLSGEERGKGKTRLF